MIVKASKVTNALTTTPVRLEALKKFKNEFTK